MQRPLIMLLVWTGIGILWAFASPGHPSSTAAVLVEMHEFRFHPAIIRVGVGRPVQMRLVNRGQIAHQLQAKAFRHLPVTIVDMQTHIEAPGLDVLRLQPGATATLSFVPHIRGRVTYACTIEGHQEAGMMGVLEVR